MDQAPYHFWNWDLSIPNIILEQGFCDANVRSELDWDPLKASLDGSSHKTAGLWREQEEIERKKIYVTTQN